MKENIYTIPISLAFRQKDGCPFCKLYENIQNESLDYALGGAMMEPHEREISNRLGFCSQHYDDLRHVGNRLSLGLMTTTHLDELLETTLSEDYISGKAFVNPRTTPDRYVGLLRDKSTGCYICNRIEDYMKHYFSNAVYMWKNEEDFKAMCREQPYFCLPHLTRFIEAAKDKLLGKKTFIAFLGDVVPATRAYTQSLRADADAFCLSFDHRNAGKPMSEGARSAIERTSALIRGAEKRK